MIILWLSPNFPCFSCSNSSYSVLFVPFQTILEHALNSPRRPPEQEFILIWQQVHAINSNKVRPNQHCNESSHTVKAFLQHLTPFKTGGDKILRTWENEMLGLQCKEKVICTLCRGENTYLLTCLLPKPNALNHNDND